MSGSGESQSWRTDELAQLEAHIEEASHALASEVERSEALVDKLDRETARPTDAEVEEFRNAIVNGPNDTPAWRLVAERIERGDFDWRDVLEGNVSSDPDVNVAFASILGLAISEDDRPTVSIDTSGTQAGGNDYPVGDEDYFNRSIFQEER